MTIASGISAGQNAVNSAGMKASDYLNQLTSGKIKVKPKGVAGIGGFVFDYEGETTVTFSAEITDHYSENGGVLNDHRIVKPIRVTLRGFVGEMVYKRKAGLAGFLGLIQSKLTTVPAYLGKYTPQALGKVQGVLTQAQNITDKVNNYAERTKNIVGMFQKAVPGATAQEKAFATLMAMHEAGTTFVVEKDAKYQPKISVATPWTVLDDMMIETILVTQGEDTKFQTDISVTLKQVRFADTQSATIDPSQFAERAAQQAEPNKDKGTTKGTTANVSLLSSVFGITQ
jgi:hypothetical protein